MAKIVVFGSLVCDLIAWVPHIPLVHETVLAEKYEVHPGGKGLCQAIAASRMGSSVILAGRIGDDEYGRKLLKILEEEAIDTSFITLDDAGTSLGIPMVDPRGNNAILGIPRAGGNVTVSDADALRGQIMGADVLIIQNELPLDAIHRSVAIAGSGATSVVWNPAPYEWPIKQLVPEDLAPFVTWLTPNEVEATQLTGIEVVDTNSAFEAARAIQEVRPNTGVVVTLGSLGAVARTKKGRESVQSPRTVTTIDSTGAGDCFTGVFAACVGDGLDLDEAMKIANVAAAVSTTVVGAASGMPQRSVVTAALKEDAGS